jgi:hypothetical protein
MRLLQKDTPFVWDDIVECSFTALKHALTNIYVTSSELHKGLYPLLSILHFHYCHGEEDPNGKEHVIYYLIKSLSGPELRYSHVEKLALAAVIVVQRFCHYICYTPPRLLRTRTPCTTF